MTTMIKQLLSGKNPNMVTGGKSGAKKVMAKKPMFSFKMKEKPNLALKTNSVKPKVRPK